MSKSLEQLIEVARQHRITPEEHDAQVRSFVYGNTHLENETITRSDVDHAVDALKANDPAYKLK
jgi:hypothetical protein